MHRVLSILLSCVLALVASTALASISEVSSDEAEIKLSKDMVLNLGDRLQYFEDPGNSLKLSDVRSLASGIWTEHKDETPSFGYSDSSYWFKFKLRNSESESLSTFLAIEYPLLDHIEVFFLSGKTLVNSWVVGDTYAFHTRPIDHRNFIFPLRLSTNESIDVFIRIKTMWASQLPITIYDQYSFMELDQKEQFVKVLYYGMMFVMVLYNLFLFLIVKERPYINYVMLVVSVLVMMSGAHGYLFQYAYPNMPVLQEKLLLLAVPSAMFFACVFTKQFLQLSKYFPRLYITINAFALLYLALCVAALALPYDISTQVSMFFAIIGCLVILFTGPYVWVSGHKLAGYFSVAWMFLVGGAFITASSKFGFFPRNIFTEYALNWGSAIEAILLSFALADRFNTEKSARFMAQREHLLEMEQRKQVESKLYHQATHHPVDGFPNRVLLQQKMHKMLHSEEESEATFCLVFVRLKRIQEVKKTLGHANADIVLSMFARRASTYEYDRNLCIPLENAEEKIHYLAHLEDNVYAHILRTGHKDNAMQNVAKLKNYLAEPIEYNGMQINLGVVAGMAIYPSQGSDITTLTRHARIAVDNANYANEHIGVYSSEWNPYSARRLALMGELVRAIEDDKLYLHFQPIIDHHNGKVAGAEALVRWHHETMGFVSPDEFVHLAEQTGIIRSLTAWVLENAIKARAEWSSQFDAPLISINISVINLQESDFLKKVLTLLKKYDVAPEDLILEVTETSMMEDPKEAMKILKEINNAGIKLAIDDFGTGYSSLGYIRDLPVYEIKIDKSFISHISDDHDDAAIAKATINLSHDLGYKVVAEGVEKQQTANLLKAMKCDFIQGYYIAKPMSFEEFGNWMAKVDKGAVGQVD